MYGKKLVFIDFSFSHSIQTFLIIIPKAFSTVTRKMGFMMVENWTTYGIDGFNYSTTSISTLPKPPPFTSTSSPFFRNLAMLSSEDTLPSF